MGDTQTRALTKRDNFLKRERKQPGEKEEDK